MLKIETLRDKVNPQREYLFDVTFPQLDGVPEGLAESLSPLVRSVQFGEYSLADTVRMRYGPQERYYAGFFDIPSLSIRFLRTAPDVVAKYLEIWRSNMVYGKFYKPKLYYAKKLEIRMYDTDGSLASQFTLEGVFPKTFPKYNLNQDGEGLVYLDTQFSVDLIRDETVWEYVRSGMSN